MRPFFLIPALVTAALSLCPAQFPKRTNSVIPSPLDTYKFVAHWPDFDLGATQLNAARARELFPKILDNRLVFEIAVYPKHAGVEFDPADLSLQIEHDPKSVEWPLDAMQALDTKKLKLIKVDDAGPERTSGNGQSASIGWTFPRKTMAIDPADPDAKSYQQLQLQRTTLRGPIVGYLVFQVPSRKKPLEFVYRGAGLERLRLAIGRLRF